MATTKQKPAQEKIAKRGPKADTLKIQGGWQAAVKKSLRKKKPKDGWPK